jgi:hypothetical protein
VGLNQQFSLIRVSLSYWQGQGKRRQIDLAACSDYVVPFIVIILLVSEKVVAASSQQQKLAVGLPREKHSRISLPQNRPIMMDIASLLVIQS